MRLTTFALLVFLAFASFCSAATSTTIKWVAGKTFATTTLTATQIPFNITRMSFAVEGSYAVIKSSFSNSASDSIYVTPNMAFDEEYSPALAIPGTSKSITMQLQANTTVYYYIEGTK